jgi:hypothetical protein
VRQIRPQSRDPLTIMGLLGCQRPEGSRRYDGQVLAGYAVRLPW